jgi:hypothetical protein
LETGVFMAVWLVLLAAGRSRLFEDPGTFWHVAVGEQILCTGTFPDHDTYSFTRAGVPWPDHEWLGDCAMALAHRVSGLDGLLLGTVTLLAGLFAALAGRLARAGMHPLWAAVVVTLAAAAGASHFHCRPHLVTIVFLALTVDLLARCDAGRLRLRALLWLVPLFVVWTNTHGGVLGGLATVWLAAAGWCVAPLLGLDTPARGWRGRVFLVMLTAACTLTLWSTPYGNLVPRTWWWIARSRVVSQVVKEHAPLEWNSPVAAVVALLAVVYLALLAGTWPRRPRVSWLLPLPWLYLACERVRHAPLFAVTAVIVVAEILPYTRWRARLAADAATAGGRWRAALVPSGVVLAAVALQLARAPVPLVGHGWGRLDAEHWPVALLPQLRYFENAEPGGTRIFNEYALGAFLIYHAPGYRVFVDDRCEVYGDDWLVDYNRGEWCDTAAVMRDWEKRYGFAYALTWRGSNFDRFLAGAEGWTLVGRTGAACFYRREAALPSGAVSEDTSPEDKRPDQQTPTSRARGRAAIGRRGRGLMLPARAS